MKKRFLAILLITATLLQLGSLSGCKQDTSSDDPSQKTMTRGEWIALLGQTLGMSDYQSDKSYYQDISSDSDIYPYVQSCHEWGVLSGDGDFNADAVATPEFVAATAALATGTVPDELLGDEKAIQEYAQEKGLLPDGRKNVSIESGLAIAESSKQIYIDDHHEDTVEVTWADGVVDLSELSDISIAGSQVTISTEQAESLAVGSVFMSPAEGGTLVARKVTSLRTENGETIIQTEEPDLGEVFDEVVLYDSSAPDLSSAILADGITAGPVANPTIVTNGMEGIYIDDLVNRETKGFATGTKGVGFTLNVNFTKGTTAISPKWEDHKFTFSELTPTFPVDTVIGASPQDDLGKIFEKTSLVAVAPITYGDLVLVDENGWERTINVENKFEGGYEITGTIGIKDLYIETGFEFKKFFGIPTGIKKVVIETNGAFTTNLSLKGTLSEELSIATLPINVGGIGTVDVELILYVDASGELQIRADVTQNVKFEYSGGNIKKTKQNEQSVSGEATIEAEAGPKLKVTLKIVGIKIIDVAISAGLNFDFEAKEKISRIINTVDSYDKEIKTSTWTYSIAFESHIRLPIVTLKIGYDTQTLANKLQIKYSWDMISKENAPVDWKPSMLNYETAIWTYEEKEELDKETVNKENDRFDLKQYTLILNGEPQQLELEVADGKKAPKVIWSSENPDIATVDDSGIVSPVSTGVTVISVTDKKDPSIVVKCTVIVQEIGENNWEFLPADMSWT